MDEAERYRAYLAYIAPTERELAAQRTAFAGCPLISVVACTEPYSVLTDTLKAQSHAHYELLPGAGDPDAAARRAGGAALLFLPGDCVLSPDALYLIASAIADGADFVYFDEDTRLSDGARRLPLWKPDFSPDTLLSYNYIGMAFAVSAALYARAAVPYSLLPDALYLFVLSAALRAQSPVRIPRMLASFSVTLPAMDCSAVVSALWLLGRRGYVSNGLAPHTFAVRYGLPPRERIAVVLVNRMDFATLRAALEALETASVFDRYSLTVVDAAPHERRLGDYYAALTRKKAARIVSPAGKTGLAALLNLGARAACAPYLLFLSPAFAPEGCDDLERLAELASQDGIGAVGGLLLEPDGAVRSCGTVVGLHGGLGSLYAGRPLCSDDPEQTRRCRCIRNVSAVPAEAMMVARDVFLAAGGFDETLGDACFDADLCLRLAEMGRRCVFTPYAVFRRHAALQKERPPDERAEQRRMDVFRQVFSGGDPCFSPALDYDADECRPALRNRSALALHRPKMW